MMETGKCILCEYDAQFEGLGALDSEYKYVCPNCGTFRISDQFRILYDKLPNHILSGYARELSDAGREAYFTLENVSAIFDSPMIPRSPNEKLDKLTIWYYKQSDFFGKYIKVSAAPAICYAINVQELERLYELIREKYLMSFVSGGQVFSGTQQFYLSISGHQYCKGIIKDTRRLNNVFIAMWFSEDVSHAYFSAIAPAIEECGFRPVRIDNIEHNNDITDEIIAGIKDSRFIVADMTGYRGGVYYEAGFAHGLGIPVIFTCRRDWFEGEKNGAGSTVKEKIHFDINHQNIIVWDKEEYLKKRIVDRIRATIL